jgi:FG-GAP-like repeat
MKQSTRLPVTALCWFVCFLGVFLSIANSHAQLFTSHAPLLGGHTGGTLSLATSPADWATKGNAQAVRGFSPVNNAGLGTVKDAPTVSSLVPPKRGAAKDFNGDGKSDILLLNYFNTTSALLMDGTTVQSSAALLSNEPNWIVSHIADFNGDGKADILWSNRTGAGGVTMWLMDGTTVLSAVGLIGADPNWHVAQVGDFNGDGRADILWQNNNRAVTLWLMNGSTVSSAIGLLGPNPDWLIVGLGDFNGDGKADILWDKSDGSVTMWLMDGGTVISAAGILGPDPDWQVIRIAAADFNGDGKDDILWRKSDGSVTMWLMDGTSVLSAVGILGADAAWIVIRAVDFNGDGKADILWFNKYDGGSLTMWIMNGTSVVNAAGIYQGELVDIFPPKKFLVPVWVVVDALDLNGDGKADLVWRRVGDNITVWLMDGINVAAKAGIPGLGGYVLP